MSRAIDEHGNIYGRLTVLRRSNLAYISKDIRWVCQCSCGAEITVIGYDLRRGETRSCGCLRKEPRQDFIKYTGAHGRVYKKYGCAGDHKCQMCTSLAENWALMKEAQVVWTNEEGLRYSPNLEDYIPLCIRCHRTYDQSP